MKVRRFIAPTARDCLRKVKDELGTDAIVVSNKPVTGGVEIMAMSADSFEALSHQAAPRPVTADAASRSGPKKTETHATLVGASIDTLRAAIPARAAAVAATEDDYTVSLSSQARKPPAIHPSWQEVATAKVPPGPPL